MAMPRGPYKPVSSCVYDQIFRHSPEFLLESSKATSETGTTNKIDKKNNNDDDLMMIRETGLYTGLCFTALAFGGTIIAPAILTVGAAAGVGVAGFGVFLAGYYAVEFVKEKIGNKNYKQKEPPPETSPYKVANEKLNGPQNFIGL